VTPSAAAGGRKHVVVGTAGHIDHGKTQLVKALTGVDADRFKEEQERGITIDIGFAPLPIDDDLMIGFVDVPGHERFVKNMLAGVWGIDMVLLVVAADESIKPQTREHFEICSLLRVKKGLVALTKMDLVDEELAELATLEIRDFVRGSFLEQSPIVGVSSRNGTGLEDLKREIATLARSLVPGRPSSLLRLPVDRSFSMRGFGTVVTGTLVSGAIAEGDELCIYPEQTRCRVRGIQVHGEARPEAHAGQRTAVNLQGIEPSAAVRGHVLSRPGAMLPSSLLDVELELLAEAPGPLEDMGRVRFHQGTSEILARVKLLERARLLPGEKAFAQVRLERPACCLPGDRFVIRRYSPAVTTGGGLVLDGRPPKHRGRPAASLLRRLESISDADPAGIMAAFLAGEAGGLPLPDLAARAGCTLEEADRHLAPLLKEGRLLRAGQGAAAVLITQEETAGLEKRVLETLAAYHRKNPLRPGMPVEEMRERALGKVAPELRRFVLDRLEASGAVQSREDSIRLKSHQIRLSGQEEAAMRALEADLRAQGLNPQSPRDLARQRGLEPSHAEKLIHLLIAEGRLVKIKDGRLFHAAVIDQLKAGLWQLLPERRVIDIGFFKDLTGTSRKNAIPLLEYLDSLKVTRRLGSDREILPPPGG